MTDHEIRKVEVQAYIYSHEAPTDEQRAQLQDFLEKKYQSNVNIVWKQDEGMSDGFRIEIGTSVYKWNLDKIYDWSREGKSRQLKEEIANAIKNKTDVMPLIKQTLDDWQPVPRADEVGTVLTVGDGIATISGLEDAEYGEILVFDSGVKGMILDLKEDDYYPVESPAPGIIDRQPVNKPMETGLLAIDSMFPIGRGQRELIIGDRQTGKTAIALDTILNQKGKDVVCIYVAIGQKASSVAQLAETLRVHGAMDYTIIVNASASDSTPSQYIAPYAGCAMGEYFMRKGKDVLIVYDDLSKHAIAYRTLSLLLERSPGREAYPGDVFYLHSRLLERSAHLSDALGGGSMTALPIVETQAGDVSAYIPTNIISITDGQIFLESNLFFAGQRPAVNIGLSVSRVGGAAQTKAMKTAAGSIRLDLAQYREMEVFTQFSSDLDDITKRQLLYGQGLMQLLKQEQYSPLRQHEQVVLLIAALSHSFLEVPLKEIPQCKKKLLKYVDEQLPDVCREIEETGLLSKENNAKITDAVKNFMASLK